MSTLVISNLYKKFIFGVVNMHFEHWGTNGPDPKYGGMWLEEFYIALMENKFVNSIKILEKHYVHNNTMPRMLYECVLCVIRQGMSCYFSVSLGGVKPFGTINMMNDIYETIDVRPIATSSRGKNRMVILVTWMVISNLGGAFSAELDINVVFTNHKEEEHRYKIIGSVAFSPE